MSNKTMQEVLRGHWSASTHTESKPFVDKCDGCGSVIFSWGDPTVKDGHEHLAAHQAAELSAAGFGSISDARVEALGALITDEALEHARKLVEEELIEWRDEGRFMLRNNGLTIRQKDGSGSEIIRFGFEMGMRMVINDHIKTVSTTP